MESTRTTIPSRRWRYLGAACLLLIAGIGFFDSASPARSDSAATSTPSIDRLATPIIPENPTPADLGRQVYYVNCMPCHGDVGQGLTDEWRAAWVEDHQNCWAKGCHGGHAYDEGYPLPRTIPAVIGPTANMAQHATLTELLAYLEQTHPPQRPGKLQIEEYEQVAAYLWQANHRDTSGVQSVPVVPVVGGLLLAVVVILLLYRMRRMRNRNEA
ncbi:MAG TPA: c-type cytochrome [Anaerolineae bacterium]|nr:c-type cytochrome [Anaerolineae bacterium]